VKDYPKFRKPAAPAIKVQRSRKRAIQEKIVKRESFLEKWTRIIRIDKENA